MCVAGFSPRAGKFEPAHWSEEQQGLYFTGYSQAYTDGFFPSETQSPVTIDLTIKPDFSIRNFGVILDITDDNRNNRIVIGQWKTSLVVLESNDYSNRLRQPKIYVPIAQYKDGVHIRIRSNERGTHVQVNGKPRGANRKLILSLPANPESSRMVLGNDNNSRNPWRGAIQSLSIYSKYIQGNSDVSPELGYKFSAENTDHVHERSLNQLDLKIPLQAVIFKKRILQLPNMQDIKEPWMWLDVLINFFGFIPFGILLTKLLSAKQPKAKRTLAVATLCAFLFSLGIEITQITIPGRSSSLADLAINTVGGLCGALLFIAYQKHSIKNSKISVST